MKVLNCPSCGASLSEKAMKADFAVCEFCGTTFHISKKLTPEPGVGCLLLGTDFGSKTLPGWELVNEGNLPSIKGTPSELHGLYATRINAYYVLKSLSSFDDFDAGINIRFTEGG